MFLWRGAVQFRQFHIVQQPDFKINGKEVLQRVFDVIDEKLFDRVPFKIIGAVEQKGIAADLNCFQLVKPGVDGRFREFSLQAGKNFIPHISDGIQRRNTSHSLKMDKTIHHDYNKKEKERQYLF